VGETTPVTPLTITAIGKALAVPPAAAAALLSPNPMTLLGVLFPADQTAAGHAFLFQDEAAFVPGC
jgi:hypothetical protein